MAYEDNIINSNYQIVNADYLQQFLQELKAAGVKWGGPVETDAALSENGKVVSKGVLLLTPTEIQKYAARLEGGDRELNMQLHAQRRGDLWITRYSVFLNPEYPGKAMQYSFNVDLRREEAEKIKQELQLSGVRRGVQGRTFVKN